MADPVRSVNSTNVRTTSALAALRVGLQLTGRLSPELAGRWATQIFCTPRRHPRPLREAVALAAARPFPLISQGRRLAAWEWGAGPTVLLVHGWEGRGSQLAALVDPLVEQGRRVLSFDAPGHGLSPGRQCDLGAFAAAIRAAGAAAGGLDAIVAHSFGAAATTLALSEEPGLVRGRAAYLAPMSSPARALSMFCRVLGLSSELRAELDRALAARVGISVAALEQRLEGATQQLPLLVVHDRDDREIPIGDAHRITRSWPGARLRVCSGLGHRRLLWDQAVVDEVAEFVVSPPLVLAPTGRSRRVQDDFPALHVR